MILKIKNKMELVRFVIADWKESTLNFKTS